MNPDFEWPDFGSPMYVTFSILKKDLPSGGALSPEIRPGCGQQFIKSEKAGVQIPMNRGPDARFVLEANHKPL